MNKSVQSLTERGWGIITPSEIAETADANELIYALFVINDCYSCNRALEAINPLVILNYGLQPCLVIFREMNIEDNALMKELRVSITPQARIYVRGIVISAWQGLERELSDREIISFNNNWIEKHFGKHANS